MAEQSGKGLSKPCKMFVGCCACSALVLAIMIPVGICVIGPHLAQRATDIAVVRAQNITISNCPDQIGTDANDSWCQLDVNMSLKNELFLGAHIDEVVVHMSNPTNSDSGIAAGGIGNFSQVSVDMAGGRTTEMVYSSKIYPNITGEINGTSVNMGGYMWAFWALTSNMAAPSGEPMNLTLTADLKVKVFGMLHYKAKLVKQLHCNCLEASPYCGVKTDPKFTRPEDFPDLPEVPDVSEGGGAIQTTMLFCEPYDTQIWNEGGPGHKWFARTTFAPQVEGVQSRIKRFLNV